MTEMEKLQSIVDKKLAVINPRRYEIDGMAQVASFIVRNRKRPFYIVADYDVDGVCSCACLVKILEHLGIDTTWYTPKRFTDGYGINKNIVSYIPDGDVVILVDNGIVAIEQTRMLKDKGCDVIILDHHLPLDTGELPPADYIIDPHAINQCEFNDYCGSGLVYKLAEKINEIEEIPFLTEIEALAGVATVADVVSLTGENWILAKSIRDNIALNKGMKALCKVMNVDPAYFTADSDAGFRLCPAINASGRLIDDGARRGVELLLSNDEKECEKLATELKTLNDNRKMLVNGALYKVEKQLSSLPSDTRGIVVIEKSINPGIAGIVAGKIAERFGIPAICLTEASEGVYKGSGRSEGPNNHLKEILDKCKDTLLGYGGHKCACGLALKAENLEAFRERFNALCLEEPVVTEEEEFITIAPDEIEDAVRILDTAAPYGQDNPKILFCVEEEITDNKTKTQTIASKYMKIIGKDFSIMCFDNLPEKSEIDNCLSVTVTGYPGISVYNGKVSYQMEAIKLQINN